MKIHDVEVSLKDPQTYHAVCKTCNKEYVTELEADAEKAAHDHVVHHSGYEEAMDLVREGIDLMDMDRARNALFEARKIRSTLERAGVEMKGRW